MRRVDPVPQAFQAPVDVHASADGQVYVFRGRPADSGGSSEDDDSTAVELRVRGRETERERLGELLLLERDVAHGDNLSKLALQYGCKVADIKRVNNLIQEQDMYALKSIKIPVKKHSLLTETSTELKEPGSSHQLQPEEDSSGRRQAQQYRDFLKEVDNDIERLIQNTDSQDGPRSVDYSGPRGRGHSGQSLRSYGADWGIHWWNAVIAMLLIGIVLPIFYVVYFKTQDARGTGMDDGGLNGSVSTSNSSTTSLSTVSNRPET
ncbi:lysM and putative peptidoglycan-binding domain-containing protein 4 [Denticeps clupeoides]|uniref:LysM and putative peptidoglycan-binding domain-containing protein 4 n=1 Tax=Denticeps clupeoides TaxID=299321 RepID=A0AAY4BM38_9TELE|nr:lysM and putative peptidoglycan-binding domain-containing protein 4 [Denticeps clupeoides]